ncbi:hypothetical protein HR060_01375 [Catenovulum sp. SM1970]|uniref:hypothetical protein n=1 Tax=Marinifaba aquimaris TaxID=2741323 RepID=UPI0015717FD2|nr:hypothetical protein [Marinifaba aquimaris]NTS75503.1 hypothetical protein [Marinifaba aquimaris]
MMKFSKTAVALALTFALAACGGSDNNNNKNKTPTPEPTPTPVGQIELVAPNLEQELVEDFPVALYVTYPTGEMPITQVTSLDVNAPDVDVFQQGIEYGAIDAASMELFYQSFDTQSDVLNAVDVERQEDVYWYVTGGDGLDIVDQVNQTHVNFSFESASLTELAVPEVGNFAWLYDSNAHQLVFFDTDTEITLSFDLIGDMAIYGLAIQEESLVLLGQDSTGFNVMHYHVNYGENLVIEHQKSWYLAGFEGVEFTDVSLMPDVEVVVSTNAQENNIFVVADRSELLGQGPIEDNGELDLVAQVAMPDSIKQPSGLWQQTDGGWYVITDQAETFILDAELNLLEQVDLVFESINCNQGCTEAIVGGDEIFFALTDAGLVGEFRRTDGVYSLYAEHFVTATDEQGDALSFSGMAFDDASQQFFFVSDSDNENEVDQLIVVDSAFNVVSQTSLSYFDEVEGSIYEYDAQGVQFYQGDIFVISERYTKLLQINMAGEILAVFD